MSGTAFNVESLKDADVLLKNRNLGKDDVINVLCDERFLNLNSGAKRFLDEFGLKTDMPIEGRDNDLLTKTEKLVTTFGKYKFTKCEGSCGVINPGPLVRFILPAYKLKNEKRVYAFEQCHISPFMKLHSLKDEDGNILEETVWSREEIERMIKQ